MITIFADEPHDAHVLDEFVYRDAQRTAAACEEHVIDYEWYHAGLRHDAHVIDRAWVMHP